MLRTLLAVALFATALLSGCDSAAREPSRNTPARPAPVLDQNFPDPDVLAVDGTYYAYATQPTGSGRNVQLATSKDLEAWTAVDSDPLPRLPAWATSGRTWAPDVTAVNGGFVMYFTARSVSPDLQCIGVARASAPAGPFTPVGNRPLVCPATEGGAIDAASYEERDGRRYLLWKNDGNCCGKDTWLYLQPMTPSGLELTGAPRRLIKQDQQWEGNLIEAPTLVRHGSSYVLFYSANDYGGEQYATGYATAERIEGPYTKAAEPLLSTAKLKVIGPGGQDVIAGADGRTRIVFHAWDDAVTSRAMYVATLSWEGERPVVEL